VSAALIAFEQAADAAFADLPAEEQAALEQRARRVVARRFDVRALDLPGIGGALLRTELRVLVAGQVGIPIPDDAHEPDTAGNSPSAHQ
jgi:hypothetical protein